MTAGPRQPTRNPAGRTGSTDLSGQCALVTGSTRGIGRGIALLLAAHGARVVVHGRSRDAVEEVRREVEALGGTAMGVLAELTSAEAVQHLHDEVTTAWGTPDIVVANAGGSPVRPGPIEQISLQDWRASIDGNLTATFLTVKAFTPGMKQRGSGAIVTMSSAAARRPGVPTPGPRLPTPRPKPGSSCSPKTSRPKSAPTAYGSTASHPKPSHRTQRTEDPARRPSRAGRDPPHTPTRHRRRRSPGRAVPRHPAVGVDHRHRLGRRRRVRPTLSPPATDCPTLVGLATERSPSSYQPP